VRYAESAATKAARADSASACIPVIARAGSDAAGEEARLVLALIRQARQEAPDERIAVLVRARSHLDALVAEIRRSAPDLRFQAVDIEGWTAASTCRTCSPCSVPCITAPTACIGWPCCALRGAA
jgi:hypothetical protein